MRALSVNNPWAWAIIHGGKLVENRSWRTRHRGALAIHAGRSTRRLLDEWPHGVAAPRANEFQFGALIGVVDVVDCVPLAEVADDPFASGPWCWVLASPRALAQPLPWRGRQLLFEVPDRLLLPA